MPYFSQNILNVSLNLPCIDSEQNLSFNALMFARSLERRWTSQALLSDLTISRLQTNINAWKAIFEPYIVIYLISVYYKNLTCSIAYSCTFHQNLTCCNAADRWPASFPLIHGSRGLYCHLSLVCWKGRYIIFFSVLRFAKPEYDNVLQPEPQSGEGCSTLSHLGLA